MWIAGLQIGTQPLRTSQISDLNSSVALPGLFYVEVLRYPRFRRTFGPSSPGAKSCHASGVIERKKKMLPATNPQSMSGLPALSVPETVRDSGSLLVAPSVPLIEVLFPLPYPEQGGPVVRFKTKPGTGLVQRLEPAASGTSYRQGCL